jgi:hypothetical protein
MGDRECVRDHLSGQVIDLMQMTAGLDFENWLGRADLGLDHSTGGATNVRFGSFVDGLGTNFESFGANLEFDMCF